MKLIGILFCALTLSACSLLKSMPTLAADEIDCGKQAIQSELTGALPDVTLALSGSSVTADLESLSVKVGENLVLCAVAVIAKNLSNANAPTAPSAAPGNALMSAAPTPVPRARDVVLMTANAYLGTAKKKPKL